MSKSDLITRLALLPDDDPRLQRVAAIINGDAVSDESWRSLKEISALTRKHVVWLARLRVPEICGERMAGRRAYKLSRVTAYL